VRLLAVADLHSRAARFERLAAAVARVTPDAVVVAGDLTSYVEPDRIIARLARLPVPVLAVRGNADLPVVGRLLDHYAVTEHLHLRAVLVGGVRVVGVSGTLPIPFATRVTLGEAEVLRRLEPLVERGTVLVAHPPPRGTLDEVFGRFHAGSAALRDLVLRREPAVLLCGHIHERTGIATLGRTLVVNCSVGRSGEGAVVTLSPGTAPRAELL
jgi:Icc-related predicted phosphoesterase